MASDEDLYLQIQAGSERAFAELYERFEQRLYGFILRRVRNPEDAEDILQDTMLALVRSRELVFARGGVAAWLYRVALNRSLHRLNRHALRSQREEAYTDADSGVDTEAAYLERERALRLGEAVRKLKPRLSQVYELWASGESYDEMAKKLDLPLGTVKSRIHTVVGRLQKELRRWHAK